MSPSDPPFHLWIAVDDTRTVAALAPLRVSKAPLKHEWGSMTDLRGAPAPQKPPNVAAIIVLATLVLIGALGLFFSGVPALAVFVLAVLVLGLSLAGVLSQAPPPRVVAPDQAAFPELHRELHENEEREEFSQLVALAERAGRALPDVEEAIEPAQGGRLLAQMLWEAAEILSRRQQLRPRVVRRHHQPLPIRTPNNHAFQALVKQREKATTLWEQTEAELARIQTALELAALAGENAAHDPDALEAVREAYRELADLYGERF
ncbi:hypothetical protein GCM10027452_00580 [Micromonospora halotolerans]